MGEGVVQATKRLDECVKPRMRAVLRSHGLKLGNFDRRELGSDPAEIVGTVRFDGAYRGEDLTEYSYETLKLCT